MVAVTYGVARAAAGAVKSKTKNKSPGLFARLITAMMDARLRQAHRELELHRHLIRNEDEPFGGW
jgi:hypothetical protein